MVNARYFVSVVAPLLGAVHGFAAPKKCTGTCVNTHDPSIIRRSDGTYFRFSTGGKIAVHTAPNITGPWKYKGAALPSGSVINLPGNQDLWAPEVVEFENTFYLYYSVSNFSSQNSAIGVATSSSLDVANWKDLGAIVQSAKGSAFNAIDPSFINAGGTSLLTFGSFWQDIHQVALANPPTKTNGNPKQIAFDSANTAEEGAALHRNGDYYYLFYSKGKCCGYDKNRPKAGEEYKILVCRSRSATGGFVDANGKDCTKGGGTVVLESHNDVYGPGGQGVYDDPTHGPILYYHYVNTTIGFADGQKRFGWNTIDFSSGWPVV